jgi:hypothetical protein
LSNSSLLPDGVHSTRAVGASRVAFDRIDGIWKIFTFYHNHHQPLPSSIPILKPIPCSNCTMSNWDLEYERGLMGPGSRSTATTNNALGLDDDDDDGDVRMDLVPPGGGGGAGTLAGSSSGMFDDGDELEDTPLQQLIRHWMNERHSPDILPAQEDLLAGLLDHLRLQVLFFFASCVFLGRVRADEWDGL